VTDLDFGSPFLTLRRFYLKKRTMARLAGDLALSAVWQSRQEEQASAALPDGFPSKTALAEAGYTAAGDLEGATTDELAEWAGIPTKAGQAVLAAWAAL
jgi:hypothetical protein